MKRIVLGVPVAVLVLLLMGGALPAADPKPAAKAIDLVICLDVSNSMDGLIASAKVKLWDIVNELARAKPTPNLRVGLYSFGNDGYDRTVGWVRKDLDLTTDLDALYQKLNALTTRGGTEYVTRVCRDALKDQKWSTEKEALRLIFVCGNEPATQDPVVKLPDAAALAKEMDVLINPIYCGPDSSRDAASWKEYASLCGGRYASINQDRGAVAIATPMDKELADLSSKLSTTYVTYGRAGKEKALNQVMQDANALRSAPAAAAARAQAKGSGIYRADDWDLVDRQKRDAKFDVNKLSPEELSEEMRKMTPEQRTAHVKKKVAERDVLVKQINDLSNKRQLYINEQMKKNPSRADKAFDEAVRGSLREQGAKKGLVIPE
jgi:hypothetical protein